MGRIVGAAVGLFCLAAAGCGTNDIMLKKQMEMESRLEQLVQAHAADSARLTRLETDLRDLQSRRAADASAIEELQRNRKDVAASLESVSQQLVTLTTPPSPTKIEVVNREAAPTEKDAGQQEAYMKAFGLFSANNYSAAIPAFEDYLRKYPKGEYAGNAQYWIGECYYTQHDYRSALDAFNLVVKNYPQGAKVPDALLKIGFTFISLNEPDKARATLESLIEKYPRSPATAKAQERLSRH